MYSDRVWIECPCIIMSVQCPMCMFSLLSEYTGRSLVINNYGSIDPLDPCILQGYQVHNNYTFINITIVCSNYSLQLDRYALGKLHKFTFIFV